MQARELPGGKRTSLATLSAPTINLGPKGEGLDGAVGNGPN